MGISSDGILCFGFDLGVEDESPEFLGEFEDLDEYLRDDANIPEWSKENSGRDYFEKVKKVIDECPVDLRMHCSYDYPMYILTIRGTEIRASRGYPEKITPDMLSVQKEKIEAAKEWCENHGVEWQEPSWILCSIYG